LCTLFRSYAHSSCAHFKHTSPPLSQLQHLPHTPLTLTLPSLSKMFPCNLSTSPPDNTLTRAHTLALPTPPTHPHSHSHTHTLSHSFPCDPRFLPALPTTHSHSHSHTLSLPPPPLLTHPPTLTLSHSHTHSPTYTLSHSILCDPRSTRLRLNRWSTERGLTCRWRLSRLETTAGRQRPLGLAHRGSRWLPVSCSVPPLDDVVRAVTLNWPQLLVS
jgi:hypothetical protein